MLDQCIIYVTRETIQIKPEFLTQADCLLDGWLPCQRRTRDQYAKHAEFEENLRFHSTFEIFADRALVVQAKSRASMNPDSSEQYVNKIEINPRKILHGHNAISITNDQDLCASLIIAKHVLSHLLVEPERASDIIPGLRGNLYSYWHKIEVALDVRDPDFTVRNHMKFMQSPRITKPSIQYSSSTHLNGTNIELKVYDKVKQLEKRLGKKKNSITPSSDEITRLELVLPKGIIPKQFPASNTILATKLGAEQRLTSFTCKDLQAMHYAYFKDIKGVFHFKAEAGSSYTKGHASAWAAIAKNYNIPTSEIRGSLEEYGGKSKDASRKMEIQILEYMEQASELSADTILSDKAYDNPPLTGISDLGGARFYVEHYGIEQIYENSEEVFAVYSDEKTPCRFTPIVTDYSYWLYSPFSLTRQPKYDGDNDPDDD